MNWNHGDMIHHPVLGTYTFAGQRCGLLWFNHSTGITQLGLEAPSIEKKLEDPESKWVRVDGPGKCRKCGNPWSKHTFKNGTSYDCP